MNESRLLLKCLRGTIVVFLGYFVSWCAKGLEGFRRGLKIPILLEFFLLIKEFALSCN